MTKLICETELMKNQKAGRRLSASGNFEVIQNADGHPLFFFIDSNHNFTLCAERSTKNTGWFQVILSKDLQSLYGDKPITAKTFDVTQDYSTGLISIALVVQVEGDDNDQLYLLKDLPNASNAAWLTSPESRPWSLRSYDGPALDGDLIITNVYMKASMESHVVCELQNETTQAISNYMVNSTGTPSWTAIKGAPFFTTLLGQVIGKPGSANHAGLYQLTQIIGQRGTMLQFLPMNPADNSIMFTPPEGARRIASLTDDNGHTSLYVAASGSVYLYPANAQIKGVPSIQILNHSLINGIQDFHVHQNDTYTLIWALNQAGEVFYSQCEKGSESDPKSWSVPMPLVDDVQKLSTYFSDTNDHSVIFVYKENDELEEGGKLVQYTQDVETSFWHQRSILLKSSNASEYLEANTFTTHIQVCDDNNLPQQGQSLQITSSSPCSVYINDHFRFLSQETALEVACDEAGVATIVQETHNLGAVCYTIAVKGSDVAPVVVNPMSKMITTMKAVKTGRDLGNIQVTNGQGVTSKLVGSDISNASKDNIAKALQGFVNLSSSFPQNGTTKHDQQQLKALLDEPFVAKGFDSAKDKVWAVSFEGKQVTYHEHQAALDLFGMNIDDAGTITVTDPVGGLWQFIKSKAGDVYQYCKEKVQSVGKFLISSVGGVIKVFVHIGEKIYRFVANCISDVLHSVEVLFKKIQVTFHKLVEWLGFVFQWADIKRAHQVTKNIVKQYLNNIPNNISSYKTGLASLFTTIQNKVDAWAELDQQPSWQQNFGGQQHSLGGIGAAATVPAGSNSPQANYGTYHLKHGMKHATLGTNNYTPPTITQQIKDLITAMETAVESESAVVQQAISAIQTNILGQLETLSFADLAKKLIAIIADLAVGTTQTMINAVLDVIAVLIEGVVAILDTPIQIPVLSSLYQQATGNQLSLLDAFCFVVSLGATVVYKVAKNEAPFPDNSVTTSIINATSWAQIQTAFQQAVNPPPQADAVVAASTNKFKTGVTIFSHFIAAFGGIAVMGIAAADQKNNISADAKVTAFFFATLPIVIDGLVQDSQQSHPTIMAETLYGITCVQKLSSLGVEAFAAKLTKKYNKYSGDSFKNAWKLVDGFFDVVFGLASLAPPIWSAVDTPERPKIAGAVTASCWNLNRVAGGAVAMAGGPSKLPRVFTFRMLNLSGYVLMCDIFILFVPTNTEAEGSRRQIHLGEALPIG